jgi:hypothetical protein
VIASLSLTNENSAANGFSGLADQLAIDTSTDTVIAADNFDGRLLLINGVTRAMTTRERTLTYAGSLAVDPATGTIFAADFNDSAGELEGVIFGPGRVDVIPPVGGPAPGASVPIPYTGSANPEGLPGQTTPGSIADDSTVQRAFVSFGSTLWVFDTSVNALEGGLSVPGSGPVAVDQATGKVYVSGTAGVTVISPYQVNVIIGDQGLPQPMMGTRYTGTLRASGGTVPYTWSVTAGTLPAGLALNPATGQITGTPLIPGTATFTVQATDSSHPAVTATRTETLTTGGCATTITGTDSQSLSLNQGVYCRYRSPAPPGTPSSADRATTEPRLAPGTRSATASSCPAPPAAPNSAATP